MQNAVDAGIAGYAQTLASAGILVSIAPVGDAWRAIYKLAMVEGTAMSATTALAAHAPAGAHLISKQSSDKSQAVISFV